MQKTGPYLTQGETCLRLGISRKALRLYEAHGLVHPERTGADWRVYGPDQIARLHQVLALKRFGFPLMRVAEILAGKLPNLAGFLEFQEQAVNRELQHLQSAALLLAAARNKLAEQGCLSSDDLIFLTRKTLMTQRQDQDVAGIYEAIAAKHLSDDDRAILAGNGYAGMDKPDMEWDALHEEARQLMHKGDPESLEAMDLAKRWMTKVFAATGGNPDLTRKMKSIAREAHETPAFQDRSSSSIDMMDFIQESYRAAIAAGLMPKP